MQVFDIMLNGRKIDRVFYPLPHTLTLEDVRRECVREGSWGPNVTVRREVRREPRAAR